MARQNRSFIASINGAHPTVVDDVAKLTPTDISTNFYPQPHKWIDRRARCHAHNIKKIQREKRMNVHVSLYRRMEPAVDRDTTHQYQGWLSCFTSQEWRGWNDFWWGQCVGWALLVFYHIPSIITVRHCMINSGQWEPHNPIVVACCVQK